MSKVVLLDSITDADASAIGRIAISGSHGGKYAAAVASRAGLRAVILNDAGIGLNNSGIEGIRSLDAVGMAACAVDCMSAEIGSASDMLANGLISFANRVALHLGISTGMPVARAAEILNSAPVPTSMLDAVPEARWDQVLVAGAPPVLCVDSASLITAEDVGRVIITGSHGGLIGGNPTRACKANAMLVSFSDAGRGKNDIGLSRLPALNERGIAAITLDCNTCAIGSAKSAIESGVISASNLLASRLGLELDLPLHRALAILAVQM